MSCCIAKRQVDQLGFRLVDQATGQDVAIGRPTPAGYTVQQVVRDSLGHWVAIVDIAGRGRHTIAFGHPQAYPNSPTPVLLIPS